MDSLRSLIADGLNDLALQAIIDGDMDGAIKFGRSACELEAINELEEHRSWLSSFGEHRRYGPGGARIGCPQLSLVHSA